jgi:exodeoxyribonuclease VII large subunit
MVADLRASTPTYAAAAVAPSVEELSAALDAAAGSMARALGRRTDALAHRLDLVASRPVFADPLAALCGTRASYLDIAHDRLVAALPNMVAARRAALAGATARLAAQGPRLAAAPSARADAAAARLSAAGRTLLTAPQRRLAVGAARLEALSPLAVIARGYAVARDADGVVVSSVAQASVGDALSVRLADGALDCTVVAVQPLDRPS